MALDDIIRSGVAIADQQTRGTQVLLWHWTGGSPDEFGVVRDWLVSERRGIVEQAARVFRGRDGKERVSETKVTLLSAVTVLHEDAFALAGTGSPAVAPVNTMGQILDVKALLDPNKQPYLVEIWMGRATGQ